jgi:uncharacterized protein YbaP (TraB family)
MLVALLVVLLAPFAQAQTGSTPLLYEVKSATTTVYLFGTIHVGARKLYPLSPAVEIAFQGSRVLALEADPNDQNALMSAMRSGLYRPPDELSKHISPALFARLEAVLPRIGLPLEYARSMKPFLLGMTIAMMEVQRAGYDAQLGLDVHFATLAREQDKPIVELESFAEQIELFNGVPNEVQEAILQVSLDSIDDGSFAKDLDDLMTAWSRGDAEGILESTRRELEGLPDATAEALYVRIYDERNRKMAQKVAGLLAGDRICFVAIGAGHLTGEAGLPALLRAKGYSVRRL